MVRTFLGEILIDTGLISRTELNHALTLQNTGSRRIQRKPEIQSESLIRSMRGQSKGKRLGDILVSLGCVTKEQIKTALRLQEEGVDSFLALGNKKLSSFFRLLPLIHSELSLPEILKEIMVILTDLVEAEAGTIMLFDEERNELVFSVPTGPAASQLVDYRIPATEGIAGWVFTNDTSILVEDAAKDERFYGSIDSITGFQTKSILCVPLRHHSRVIGVLEVINRRDGGVFSREDELLLIIFASQAALAIENNRVYAELNAALGNLKKINQELLRAAEEHSDGLAKAKQALVISERKLEEREAFFREMVESSVEVISRTDSSGIIEYVSPSIEMLLGYKPEEVIGRHYSDFVFKDDRGVASQAIEQGFLRGQTINENRLVAKNGDVKWVRFSSTQVTDDKGKIGLQGVLTDVTETKMLQSMIMQKERFAALGQLAAAVAHEMNSPLQGISSLISAIERKSARTGKSPDEEILLLREAFSRIEETVNKLLSLGRPGEENRIGIRVNECVEKVLSLEESLLRKHRIRIAFQPDPSDPVALISSSGLGQILINLINNAVDAFEEASGIRNIRIAVSSPAPGTTLEILFEDTGPGFKPEVLPHLFKPFYTGTGSRGLGVGLGICKSIAEGCGGTITASNRENGRGAAFRIRLPMMRRGN